jgi:hypothetical protein
MKIRKAGLKQRNGTVLSFEQGSAFELKPQSDEVLPVAICLVNSIGVMQGFEGAVELFKSMRRAVESANGIAIISCYQQEYIDSYGLGQYESTMEVSGQPVWLAPDTYSSQEYKQIPRHYKLAHNADSKMIVDVFDMQDRLIQEGYVLSRDKDKIEQTIESGDINTYSEYRSHWYSFDHLDQLIHDHWDSQRSYHLKCRELDIVRAEPAQLAILDYSDQLNPILEHWNVL